MSPVAILILLLLAGFAGFVALGAWIEAIRDPVTDADRDAAPGTIHTLSAGRTHARRDGPEGGRPVVLIHGLSTPSPVWEPLVRRLSAAGYRTLVYDLYGRGLSDRPNRPHDARLYTRQLADLLDAEGIGTPVPLVGYSMGGSIAAAFADAYPDRVSGIALLAPAGLRSGLSGFTGLCARLPFLGDALWSLQAGEHLRAGARAESRNPRCELTNLTRIMTRETKSRGYLPALLSSARNLLGKPQDATHRALGERGTPVLAIWGAEDAVIPLTSMGRLGTANPQAESHALADAGHGLVYTHADDTAGWLTDWLSRTTN